MTWRWWFCLLCVSLLSATHLLLPIERYFPTVDFLGFPVTVTILASGIVFLACVAASRGGLLLRALHSRFALLQLLFLAGFSLSALFSPEPISAFFVVTAYTCAFLLNYLILLYFFEQGMRPLVTTILCAVGAVAAFAGLYEGLTGTGLPFYEGIRTLGDLSLGIVRDNSRVFGTLGNPIVYSVAMALLIPFAAELRWRWLRLPLIGLFALAAIFTQSRIVLIFFSLFAIGQGMRIATGRAQRIRASTALLSGGALVLALLAVSMVGPRLFRSESDSGPRGSSLLSQVSARLGIGVEEGVTTEAEINTQARLLLLGTLLDRSETLDQLIIGTGIKTAGDVASEVFETLRTLDNSFATLYIESGLLCLLLYVWIYGDLLGRSWGEGVNLHWYNVLALVLVGVGFASIYYATFNFVGMASAAALTMRPEPAQTPQAEIS